MNLASTKRMHSVGPTGEGNLIVSFRISYHVYLKVETE
jgi:hypothetical protein